MSDQEIVVYKFEDTNSELTVTLEDETVWLNQDELATLFDKGRATVAEHIGNVFKEGELEEKATCRKFRQVRREGNRDVTREITYYNLDIIISVGYRVKSKRGTQFRIWATKVLKANLLATKEKLSANEIGLARVVKLIGSITDGKELDKKEATGLLQIIKDYAYALDLLDDYDHQRVGLGHTTLKDVYKITYNQAINAIAELKLKMGGGDLFGNEKDDSFKSSLTNIYQTFDGKDLYPSIEEKAANLLYFITKNHSFSDGNKRIAAFIFIWFLERNGILYNSDRSKRIADNALVALTLMIAESSPPEREMVVNVVINLIDKQN